MTGMNLSAHFTLEEMARTEIRRFILPNIAELESNARALSAMKILCNDFLEPMRAHFNAPVIVHSGFRGAALNAAVGGVASSQHCGGQAIDFHVHGHSIEEVFLWIKDKSGFKYGQNMQEGTWNHLSLGEPFRLAEKSRQDFRVTPDAHGKMVYQRII